MKPLQSRATAPRWEGSAAAAREVPLTIDSRTRAARIKLGIAITTAGVLAVPVVLGLVGAASAGPERTDRADQETPVTQSDGGGRPGELAIDVDVFRDDQPVARSDQVAIEAFVNPPSESGLDALDAESLSDAAVRQSILDREATESADVLEELDKAREEEIGR